MKAPMALIPRASILRYGAVSGREGRRSTVSLGILFWPFVRRAEIGGPIPYGRREAALSSGY